MTNRLEEIKASIKECERVFGYPLDQCPGVYDFITAEDVQWLVSRVERLEKFQSEVRRLWVNDFGDSMVDVLQLALEDPS